MGEREINSMDGEVVSLVSEEVTQNLAEKAFSLDKFTRVEPGENLRWAHVEEGLKREVLGQDEAIERVVTALYRDALREPNTPIAVIGLFGQTGTGKTHLVEMLDKFLHPNRPGEMLTVLNGTEFKEAHLVASLVGSPPGYVGREQKPMLDKKKIEQPYSIVLIDEFEKAHQSFHDLFMQAFDKGKIRLQNGGQVIDFSKTIFILTSNIGAEQIRNLMRPMQFGLNAGSSQPVNKKNIDDAVAFGLEKRSGLRPEMINRIEEKIVFASLNDEQLGETLRRYIARQNANYKKQSGIELTLSPELIKELVESCNANLEDRRMYGARPIIQKYKRLIEGRIAKSCADGGIPTGSQVYGTLSDKTSNDQMLEERLEMWRAEDTTIQKQATLVLPKKGNAEKKEVAKPAALNQQMALGAMAVGVAALLFKEYLGSRNTKARRAW